MNLLNRFKSNLIKSTGGWGGEFLKYTLKDWEQISDPRVAIIDQMLHDSMSEEWKCKG